MFNEDSNFQFNNYLITHEITKVNKKKRLLFVYLPLLPDESVAECINMVTKSTEHLTNELDVANGLFQ